MAPSKPRCDGINSRGEPCSAPVMADSRWCFFHSPESRTEAAEARRLGGLRRRREGAVAGAYDFEGIASVPQVRRVLEIAISDALGLENSLARSRTRPSGELEHTTLDGIVLGLARHLTTQIPMLRSWLVTLEQAVDSVVRALDESAIPQELRDLLSDAHGFLDQSSIADHYLGELPAGEVDEQLAAQLAEKLRDN